MTISMSTVICTLQVAIPLAYFAALLFLPRGYWATLQKLKEDDDARKRIETAAAARQDAEKTVFRDFLSAHPKLADDPTWLREKVYRAIDYAIRRHDWYEDQRARMFQVLLAVLTISVSFVGLVLTNTKSSLLDSWGLLAILSVVFVALARAIFLYNHALDADRPYRLVSDIRFWFFRYNLPEHSEQLTRKPDVVRIATRVLDERDRFLTRIKDNLDPANSLREDFEQIFILHVLQRYKHESLQRLSWLLAYSLVALLVLVVLALLR